LVLAFKFAVFIQSDPSSRTQARRMAKRRRQDPHQIELQEKLTEAVKQRAVDSVLEIYREWEASGIDIVQSAFGQALSALAHEDTDDKKAGEYFEYAKVVFERARLRMQGKRGEPLYTLMVRLASRAGAPLAAMEYLNLMRQPPLSIKPKLRTFIPILESCVRGGLSDEAEELWEDLFKNCRLVEDEAVAIQSTDVEDRLWQYVFSLRLRAWVGDVKSRSCKERRDRLNTILHDIKMNCMQMHLKSSLDEALRTVFKSIGWETSEFEEEKVSADGRCPLTSTVLQALQCDEADLRSLAARIEQLAIEGQTGVGLQQWKDFKELLRHPDNEWDTVIDGANVGHHNQNHKDGFFLHSQINEVVLACGRDSGRRRTVVVLRNHWLLPSTNLLLPAHKRKKRRLPPIPKREGDCGVSDVGVVPEVDPTLRRSPSPPAEPQGFCELAVSSGGAAARQRVAELSQRWRERGQLCTSPSSIDDDWVALYIAVVMCVRGVHDVQLVTNDEFRDHFWRMRQPQVFKAWCERHTTPYFVHSERPDVVAEPVSDSGAPSQGAECLAEPLIRSVQVFPPPAYSRRVQARAEGGCWHFPLRRSKESPPPEGTSPEPKTQPQDVSWGWLVAWDPSAIKASPEQR